MLSGLLRALLAVTALSPAAFVFAIVESRRSPTVAFVALVAGAVLVVACIGLLTTFKTQFPSVTVEIKAVKEADKEVLPLLVAWTLPLIAGISLPGEREQWAALLLIAVMLFGVLIRSRAIAVNPVLALLGWHFYEVTDSQDFTYTLIARDEPKRSPTKETVKAIFPYTLLLVRPKK